MKYKNHYGLNQIKNNFDSLIQDVSNNLNNDKSKTTVYKKAHDLKNAKKFLVKIATQKISEKKAHELYLI